VKDETGRYRHARRAPVDENTLQPMRRVSKAVWRAHLLSSHKRFLDGRLIFWSLPTLIRHRHRLRTCVNVSKNSHTVYLVFCIYYIQTADHTYDMLLLFYLLRTTLRMTIITAYREPLPMFLFLGISRFLFSLDFLYLFFFFLFFFSFWHRILQSVKCLPCHCPCH